MNACRLSSFYREVQPSQNNIPILDLSTIPKEDRHVHITVETAAKEPNSLATTILVENDVLLCSNHIFHVLQLDKPVAVTTACKVLRRLTTAPDGIPAYMLPMIVKRSINWRVRTPITNTIQVQKILNEIAPTLKEGEVLKEEAKVLAILKQSSVIIQKCRMQIKNLHDLQCSYISSACK